MKFIVYKSTNMLNGKVYIGITMQGLATRKGKHKFDAKKNKYNQPFYNAINKYGWDCFSWEVIDTAGSYDELREKEIYWISFFNSYIHAENPNGYNATLGGEGTFGQKHTEQAKQKMSESSKGNCNVFKSGSDNPQSVLNEDKVREIRALYATGEYTQQKLADMFGIHNVTCSKVVNRKSWRDVS